MAGLRDLKISARRVLPNHLLSVRFSCSGGPGGQNVNKVATKVDLRLDLIGAEEFLGLTDIQRIRSRLANRIDSNGHLQVISSEQRDQPRNLIAALSRMESLIQEALKRPKKRRPTKPTFSSQENRIAEKKRRSRIKKLRSDIPLD